MGDVFTKEADMNSSSIEAFYAARAVQRQSGHENQEAESGDEEATASDPNPDRHLTKSEHANDNAREILRAISSRKSTAATVIRFKSKVQDSIEHAKRAMKNAIEATKKAVLDVGVQVGQWVRQHPWATAAILITIVLLSCTPAILGAVEFTSGGILAGSIAAGIQAGIGSVMARSLFAILTSCAMGGYGVVIVAGGVVSIAGIIIGAIVSWTTWKDSDNGGHDDSALEANGLRLKLKED